MGEWDSQKILEIWDGLAEAWDRNRDLIWSWTRPISEHLVALLDPKEGETILEVGAGMGETGFLVAERLGPTGRLISSDFSSAMSDRARDAATRLGLTNVEFRVMDAMALDMADGSVDGVIGRLVYHLVPDPVKAFAEARRAIRRGGRLCFTVFGPDERRPFDQAVSGTIEKRGLRMPPGITIDVELNNERVIREITTSVGFEQVDVHEVPFALRFDDTEGLWNYLTEIYGRAADLIRGLPRDEREGFRTDFLAALAPFRAGAGYEVPGLMLNVRAS